MAKNIQFVVRGIRIMGACMFSSEVIDKMAKSDAYCPEFIKKLQKLTTSGCDLLESGGDVCETEDIANYIVEHVGSLLDTLYEMKATNHPDWFTMTMMLDPSERKLLERIP